MQISLEPYSEELASELNVLLEGNMLEISTMGSTVNYDKLTYIKLQKIGALKLFVFREHDVPIGYAIFVVSQYPHDIEKIVATQLVMFMGKEHRGRYGRELLRQCEVVLANSVDYIVIETIPSKRDLSVLLEREGYGLQSKLYFKRLS